MNIKKIVRLSTGALLMAALTGCTIHPPGERQERVAALRAGKPFTRPVENSDLPRLSDDSTVEDLVQYALMRNAELEQRYWEWRSALEQVPQDGTQATNLVLSANLGISRGKTSFDRTTLTAGNDPMADLVLPPKLSIAARRALESARAAGLRFRKTQFDLRNKVVTAYCDYALTTELIQLEQANGQLLKTTAMVVEARNRAGAAGQLDLLKARNEVDLSANDAASMQAQLPAELAALNALLGRPSHAPIAAAAALPRVPAETYSDERILARAASHSPGLSALAREIAARSESVKLAKLQYLPDFSVSAGADLQGIGQSLLGMVTVPLLRHEAIDAAVAQAEAGLRAAEAMRRQAGSDLNAQIVMDLSTLRDADRQLEVFDHTILPRATQGVTIARSAYESGAATLLDLLDSQRSLISIKRLVANLRLVRSKRLADLEAITAGDLIGI